jgi:hypothetical protein
MPTPHFFQNYIQVVAAAQICLEKKLQMPALILIYTLMDTFAWSVYGADEKQVRKRFEMWTQEWVFGHAELGCTPTELYAARCAVLHTMTSDANLTDSGEARRIAYAWGTSSAAKLQSAVIALGHENIVCVQIEALFGAVREAMAQVVERSQQDSRLRLRLEHAASKHFASMEDEKVEEFLQRVHGTKGGRSEPQ